MVCLTFRSVPWLAATALIVASCSQGGSSGPITPSAVGAAGSAGTVGLLADGDVKTGSGPITIESVRMDRQTPSGASVLRQYANPGQEYRMVPGETIELWMEWVRGGNNAPSNPRFLVDWGEGEIDRFDFTPCGSCLLKHKYPQAGRYAVKVTLDDRAGTTVTRTFYLNSLDPVSCAAPTSDPISPADMCDGDGTFATAPFFHGNDLVFSLGSTVCAVSSDVTAMGSPLISINPTTGVITASGGTFCPTVIATNACGSTSRQFKYRPNCT